MATITDEDRISILCPIDEGGLTLRVLTGRVRFNNTTYAVAQSDQALTDNTTNYVFVNSSGAVAKNTTGFPSDCIPLAEAVTVAGDITSLTDKRAAFDREVTSTAATEGIIELATQAEVDAGADAVRAVTPLTLATSSQWAGKAAASHTHLEADVTDLDHTDATAIHDNIAAEINAIAAKASPVGADVIIIEDSAASFAKKKVTITNLPGGADADAIHDNVAAEISVITEKVSPIGADLIIIEDSAASNAKKRVKLSNLPAGGGDKEVFFQASYAAVHGDYNVVAVSTNGTESFTFFVPYDFTTLTSLVLVGIPSAGAAGTGKDIDLTSDYAGNGQLSTTHSESDAASTYDTGSADTIFELDVSGVFSSIAAGDYCGLKINHNAVGGAIDYLGIKMRYS